MGCLILLLAIFSPRLALILIWLGTDILGRAFENVWVAVIGFFLLPWTTLAYVVMWNAGTHAVTGFEWFIVVLAFLGDLGAYSRARDDH